jgi:hypothetical protein
MIASTLGSGNLSFTAAAVRERRNLSGAVAGMAAAYLHEALFDSAC